MDLNKRQRTFLLEAFRVAPSEGIPIDCQKVGKEIGFDQSASRDIAQQLENRGLPRVESDAAYLNADGREEARAIDAEAVKITLDAAKAQLLLRVVAAADRNGELVSDAAITAEEDRRWLLDNKLIVAGKTFGHSQLTQAALDAVGALKRHLRQETPR